MKKSALTHLMSVMLFAPILALASADQSIEASSVNAGNQGRLFLSNTALVAIPQGEQTTGRDKVVTPIGPAARLRRWRW